MLFKKILSGLMAFILISANFAYAGQVANINSNVNYSVAANSTENVYPYMIGWGHFPQGTPSNNTLNLNANISVPNPDPIGGGYGDGFAIGGAKMAYNSINYTNTDSNTVNIGNVSLNNAQVSGGGIFMHASTVGQNVVNEGNVSQNTVNYSGTDTSTQTWLDITGGRIELSGEQNSTLRNVGNITNNQVNITGGNFNSGVVGGSLSTGLDNNYSGTIIVNSEINNNSVNMTDGSARFLIGGSAEIDGVSDSQINVTVNMSNNTVTMMGGTVTQGIAGASIEGYYDDIHQPIIDGNKIHGDTINNTVTVGGTASLPSTSVLYGAINFTGGDAFSGNTLNFGLNNVNITALDNFQYYNFALPDSVANNNTVLTVTQGNGASGWFDDNGPIKVNGSTVNITRHSSALNIGDKATLITETGGYGFNGTIANNNTVITNTENNITHSYKINQTNNSITMFYKGLETAGDYTKENLTINAGANAGEDVFLKTNGTLYAQDITLNSNNNASATLYANALDVSANNVNLTLNNTYAWNGSTGVGIGNINVASAKTLAVNGGAFALGTLNNAAGGTVSLNNTAVAGGNIINSGTVNTSGTVNFNSVNYAGNAINNNGTLNLNSNNTALNFAVAGTGITNLNGNFTWAEGAALNKTNLPQGSTLDIGTNSVNINGNTNINGTLKMTLDNVSQGSTDMTDNGSLHILGGSLTLGDNSALSLRVNSLEKGQSTGELALFSADNGINGDFASLTDLRYNVQHGSSEGYYIVSYTHSAQDIVAEEGGTVNNQQTAAAWDNIDTSALNQQGQAVYNQLDDLSRSAAQSEKYLEALTTLAPSDSQFVVAGTQAVNKQINANISKHLQARQEQTNNYRQNTYKNTKQKRTKDSLYNTYNLYRGSSGGDETSPYSVWVQGLFSYSSQDKSSKTAGFDGTLTGVSAGFDKAISENFILGIGYAYDHIKTDSAQRDVVANGHNGFIYAFWQPSQWYLSGTASYGLSKYNEDKNVGGVKVDGDYDVQNISAQGILGYQFAPAWSMQGGLIFTNINQKEYTDSASQKIKADDNTVLTGVIGVQYAQETSINSFVFTPKAHLGVSYDLASSGDSATVNIAGNTYKVNSEKLDKFAFEAGVGMETDLSDDVGFALGYDFELRGNFTSHTGNIKFVYHF